MTKEDFKIGIRFVQTDSTLDQFDQIQIVEKVDDYLVTTNLKPEGFGLTSIYAKKCVKL